MTVAQEFLAEFEEEMEATRRMLERVPDEALDFRPHPKSMSMGSLAGHIAEMIGWAAVTARQQEFDIDPPGGQAPQPYVTTSRAAMLVFFDSNVVGAKREIAEVNDEDMQAPWTFLKGGNTVFKLPRIKVLRKFCLNHIIHHRAQLGIYLRLNNVPVPGPYGPSADDV